MIGVRNGENQFNIKIVFLKKKNYLSFQNNYQLNIYYYMFIQMTFF